MKIICLDQSTKVTGYSIWKNKELHSYGTLDADPKEKKPIERMYQMYFKIKELIDDIKPDFVVIEGVQFQNNYKTYSH